MKRTYLTVNASGRAQGIAGYLVQQGHRFSFEQTGEGWTFTVYADRDALPFTDDAGSRVGVHAAARETGKVIAFPQRAIA